MSISVKNIAEHIVLIIAPTCLLSKKRLGFVHIVVNHLPLIHQHKVSAVRGNVELRDQKQPIGRCAKEFFANVNTAERNFGKNLRILRIGKDQEVVRFVLVNAGLILNELKKKQIHGFMRQVDGFRRERELLKGTTILAKIVDLMVKIFTSTIRNLKGTAEQKKIKISLPCVCLAT
jgi:hypothetical protein